MKFKQSWENMDIFRGIDLLDSYVTSWELAKDQLSIQLDISIWPESALYTERRTHEYTCYKSSRLVFTKFSDIKGLIPIENTKPAIDANGEFDYGNIEYFTRTEKEFEIHGEFGQVLIFGGEFRFEMDSQSDTGKQRKR